MTPTQRSLEFARSRGWKAGIVEKWNPHARVRIDLFGFADLVVFDPGIRGVTLVQTTSGPNVAQRVEKIKLLPQAADWLTDEIGRRIEVWGWRKAGERGRRKLWQIRRVKMELDQKILELCSREVVSSDCL